MVDYRLLTFADDAGHEVVGYKRSGIEALTEIGDTVLATTFSSTTPVRTA